MNYSKIIAENLNLNLHAVERTLSLLSEGATIPFIARYRKEATGGLNEVQITAIAEMYKRLVEVDTRRKAVLESISSQGKLTAEIQQSLEQANTLTDIEDIYQPFRPKRRTRATIAIEQGYEPLADMIMDAASGKSRQVIDTSKYDEAALKGASDIIAERVSDNASVRQRTRNYFMRYATLSSSVVKSKEEEATKYKNWFEWHEKAQYAPSHRILALLRGEREGLLKVHIRPDDTHPLIEKIGLQYIHRNGFAADVMQNAITDGCKRLLFPSIENDMFNLLKEKADKEAVRVFADNLRQLLLAPPLGQKRVLAIDPGFRTGCKVVCLDEQGSLLHNETIYPFTSLREERAAINKLEALVEAFHIDAIAVGNGTAGRETEDIVAHCRFKRPPIAVSVDESGASIYSASECARREFPDYDITVRGAVSIGRRLIDPLSELVKIDPKNIGVGQYQHDVDQKMLEESLKTVVESCVNAVGVELNTASEELLSYVSGIGSRLASAIVKHREANGAFTSRQQLLEVKGFGNKIFEQCAGFLRIRNSSNPLDRSAVHPERYDLVEKMAASIHATVQQLIEDKELRKQIDITKFATADCGLPTLNDIMSELDKPGRDPRAKFETLSFDKTITKIEDVKEGMVLPGIVTNITAFGAFVDIGIHQDGLVHISQLADRRINDVSEVLHLRQHIMVKVLEVDLNRRRISLTMKGL